MGRKYGFYVFLFCWISLLALALFTGPSPVNRFGHDTFILLDGAWRIIQGQIPYSDFHLTLGSFPLTLVATAMKLTTPSADALPLAGVLLAALLMPTAYGISRNRYGETVAVIFSLVIGATCVGRQILGLPVYGLSYASVFNRYAYAVLSLVFAANFPKPGFVERQDDQGAPVVSGFLVAILLFTKLNFFALALGFSVVGVVCGKRPIRRLVWFLGTFCIGVIALGVTIRFNYLDFLRESFTGLLVRKESLALTDIAGQPWISSLSGLVVRLTPIRFLRLVMTESRELLLIAVACLCLWKKGREMHLTLAYGLLAVVGSLFLVLSNFQWGECPVLYLTFLLLGRIAIDHLGPGRELARVLVYSWPLFFIASNLGSVALAFEWQLGAPPVPAEFSIRSKALQSLVVLDGGGTCQPGDGYVRRLNDGLELLKKFPSNTRVLSADFSNPFSIARLAPSPRGDLLYWDNEATFNLGNFRAAESLFQDTDVVMVPKCAEHLPSTQAFLGLYQKAIDQAFSGSSSSAFWIARFRSNVLKK